MGLFDGLGTSSAGALDVGSVKATLGYDHDKRGLREWDRAVDGARRDSRRPITQDLKGDYDRRGFDSYDRATSKAHRNTTLLGRATSLSSRGFGLFARGAGIAGTAAGVAFFYGTKKAVEASSDLNESLNASEAIFESSGKRIANWSKDTADAFGLARSEALQGAASIGAMLKPMGFAVDKASDMSMKMVELAGDMASFNNQDPSEMLERIRSGLAGESEPLRQFGVDLRVTAVEQFALNRGILEQGEKLEGSKFVMAAYAKILSDTKDQQGDFARTSEGMANAQRRLRANVIDLAAGYGSAFRPMVQGALGDLNDFVVQMKEGRGEGGRFADFLVGIGKDVEGFAKQIENVLADDTLDPKAKAERIFGMFADVAGDALEAAVPRIADAAAEAAPRVASAFVHSFIGADSWGRLALGAFLITKLGGAGAFIGAGKRLGGGAGSGMSEGILGGLLAGGAGGSKGGKGGLAGRLGGLLSAAGPIAKRLGVIGLGLTIGDSILSSIDQGIREGSDDIGEALEAKTEDVKIGPLGLDRNDLGFEAETLQAESLKGLFKSMTSQRVEMASVAEKEVEFMAREVDLSQKASEIRDRMFRLLKQGRGLGVAVDLSMDPKKLTMIKQDLGRLKAGVFTTTADIEKASHRVSNTITDQFGAGTKEARHLSAENLRATAQAFARSMKESGNYTEAGLKKIKRLIKQADLVEGLHPAEFGRAFANAFGRAGNVTETQLDKILEQFKRLPKGARQAAYDAMNDQLRELRRGGKLSAGEVKRIRSAMLSEFGGLKQDAVGSTFDLTKGVLMNFGSLGNGIAAALSVIQENTNKGLGAFGVSPVKWVVKAIGNLLGAGGGKAQHKARGGFLEGPSRADVVPVLAGRDEAFVTSWQQRPINAALQFASAHGVVPYQHLGALFADERRPHAAGPPVDRKASGGFPGVQVVNTGKQNNEAGSVNVALAAMERLASMHIPYDWGGGHGGWDATPAGLDCSGAVSLVLHEAGLLASPLVSGALESWGAAGPGAITVYANPSHAWMEVNGRPWGTSVNDSSHGLGFYGQPSASYKAGFTARHAAGAVMTELAKVLLEGPDGPMKSMGQAAIDDVWSGANKYLKSKMPNTFGGGDANIAAGDVRGKVSFFSGAGTAGGKNASRDAGLALNLDTGDEPGGWNNATTQGWMQASNAGHPVFARTTIAGHTANLPIIDLGPASWTGRSIDVTEPGVHKLGLNPATFPTDSIGTAEILRGRGGFARMSRGGIPGQILDLYSQLTKTKAPAKRDNILDEIGHLEDRLKRKRKKKRQAHYKAITAKGTMAGFAKQIASAQDEVTKIDEQIGGLETSHNLTDPREVEEILRGLGMDPESDLTKLTDEQKAQVRSAIDTDYGREEAETNEEVRFNERELRGLLNLRRILLAAIKEGERRIRVAERKAKQADEEQKRLEKAAREVEREIEKLQEELQDLSRGKPPERQKGESKEAHERKVEAWQKDKAGSRRQLEDRVLRARANAADFKERARGWGNVAAAHRANATSIGEFVTDEARPTLVDVQGTDRSMDPNVQVAPLGVGVPQFGGQILDSQAKLAELGSSEFVRPDPFKAGAGEDGLADQLKDEKLQLTEEELARYKRNELVMAAQAPIFAAAKGFPRLLAQGGFALDGMLAPFVGSFRVGTQFVPRDGLAMVHRGEEIRSKERVIESGNGDVYVALTGDLGWLSPFVQAHITDELEARGQKAAAARRRPATGVIARRSPQ